MNTGEKQHLYASIGKLIKDYRKKAKYSQTDFAKLLGMSRTSIVNIEQGNQQPSVHLLYNIANIFKINMESLLPNSSSFRTKKENAKKRQINLAVHSNETNIEFQKDKLVDFIMKNSK